MYQFALEMDEEIWVAWKLRQTAKLTLYNNIYQWQRACKPASLQTQIVRGNANQSITDDQKHCQSRVWGSTADVNIVSSRITVNMQTECPKGYIPTITAAPQYTGYSAHFKLNRAVIYYITIYKLYSVYCDRRSFSEQSNIV